MKWLTRELLTGGLSDEEWEQQRMEERQHMEALVPLLSDGADTLATLNLHDAQPLDWKWAAPNHFQMTLLIGDLQQGYQWAEIRYDGAELVDVSLADLEHWPLSEREIGEEEFDVAADGRFEHRLLLWPDGEFGVRFSSAAVRLSPASASDRRSM